MPFVQHVHFLFNFRYLEFENKAAYLAGVVSGAVPLPTPGAIYAEARYAPLREVIWESWADNEDALNARQVPNCEQNCLSID